MQPGVYELKYDANGYTSAEETLRMWHQRAAKLCGAAGYDADPKVGKTEPPHGGEVGKLIFDFPLVEGTVTCRSTKI